MHPSELSYPCYLSILGDLAKVTPHEESFPILNPETANFQTPKNTDRIEVLENSPSGLWRTLGKRVGCNALRGSNPLFSASNSLDLEPRTGLS